MSETRMNLALCKAHSGCTSIAPVYFCAGVDTYPRLKLCRDQARWFISGEEHRFCTRHAADLLGETAEGQAIVKALEEDGRHRPLPRRITSGLLRSRSDYRLWVQCCEGKEPAEVLNTRDREDLVWHLHEQGLTDQEIGEHTRMTLYTAARIRGRLGLRPNQPHESMAAA